jgi:zinc D-Ala-D-Ala carboxypeptidase
VESGSRSKNAKPLVESVREVVGDIPEALREAPVTPLKRPPVKWNRFWWGVLGLAIALLLGWLFKTQLPVARSLVDRPSAIATSGFSPAVQSIQKKTREGSTSSTSTEITNVLLGHFAYAEAPPNTLIPISQDTQIRLRQAAATHLKESFSSRFRDSVPLKIRSICSLT